MNDFNQAFRILVNDLEDFCYAEDYCRILSNGRAILERQMISHQLFQIYLQSFPRNPERFTEAILHLLANNQIDFNFLEILQSLPASWPIALTQPIFERAFRLASKRYRCVRLELALARLQNEKLHVQLAKLKRSNVLINKYRRCKYCLHQFYEASCVIDQDGSQMHVHCARMSRKNQPE